MKAYFATVGGGFLVIVGLLALPGCMGDGTPTLLPNSDSNLRKSSTEFAADAAKRSFEASAPKGETAVARAEYNLSERQFDVANLTNQELKNVEFWVNQKYVVNVPEFSPNSGKTLNFELFYDSDGHHFATEHGTNPIHSLQMYSDGKMYDVVATLE